MQDYRNLETWQVAHALVMETYRATEGFPRSELYGLTSQIRRAVVSIPANIAEGVGRRTDPSTRHFLEIASGSASELDYLLLLSRELGMLAADRHSRLESSVLSVRRLLNGFIRRLRRDRPLRT